MIWYMNVHIVTSAVFHPIACGAVRSNPISWYESTIVRLLCPRRPRGGSFQEAWSVGKTRLTHTTPKRNERGIITYPLDKV